MSKQVADLPRETIVADLPPFTNIAMDDFGPVDVKRGRNIVKQHGVIFTCQANEDDSMCSFHLEAAYCFWHKFLCQRFANIFRRGLLQLNDQKGSYNFGLRRVSNCILK